jgi:hypothetical protein
MSDVVAVLCIFAVYVADGWRRDGFTGRWGGKGTTCHRRGKGKVMRSPLKLDHSSKYVSKLLPLLALLSSAHAARPWGISLGYVGSLCTWSGDYDGAPLVRAGSCPYVGGYLNLYSRGITSVSRVSRVSRVSIDSFAECGGT